MSCFGVTMNKDFAEAVVFTGLCSYLFKAFFLLQWNPADWEQTDRIGMIVSWVLSLVLIMRGNAP